MKTIVIPNAILMEEVGANLDKGSEVTLRAKGRSMRPNIRDGRDSLVLRKADVNALRKWDVVLAQVTPGHYVIHRVIALDGDNVVLKGDGNFRGTEKCRRKDVMGLLVAIERNGRRIDCTTVSRVLSHILRRNFLRVLQCGRYCASKTLRALHLDPIPQKMLK